MPPPLENKSAVIEYIDANMVEFNFRDNPQMFLPQPHLDEITKPSVIRNVIKHELALNNNDLEALVKEIYERGRKLFATCVYCSATMEYLKVMLENRLSDSHLPLGKPEDFGSLSKFPSTRHFISMQAHFNTIYLSKDSFEGLDNRKSNWFTLPIDYEESEANTKGKGAFGTVYMCKIHRDHRSFECKTNSDDMFALKVTQHERREHKYHMAMAGLNHLHLVKCLFSFTLGSKYQMVYDLANCDLEDFMSKYPVAARAPGVTPSWLPQQLAGLAGALKVVHNPDGSNTADNSTLSVPQANQKKTGYIHDIKPENILLFTEEGNVHWLRLSDFSCAKVVEFIATISGKRDSYKTGTKSGTPVYRAPESLEGATSRPYDIWSLGCVYLESLVWFVDGYQALLDFRESREDRVRPDGLIDQSFFRETESGDIQLRKSVVDKIEDLKLRCSGELEDIIEIVPSLLKIKAKERPTASELVDKLSHLSIDMDSMGSGSRLGSSNTFKPSPLPVSNSSDSEFDGYVKVIQPSDE